MTHGKRHQKQFRSSSASRKAKAMSADNERFEQETERIIANLKQTMVSGTHDLPNGDRSITLRAAAAQVILKLYEDESNGH